MKAPQLPEEEKAFLTSLDLIPRCHRVQTLCKAGWSLQSIADAFSPPRRRSTIRSWQQREIDTADAAVLSAITPLLMRPFPLPPQKKERPRRKRPVSPGIPVTGQLHMASLAPLARRYRSRTKPDSSTAQANQQLSKVAVEYLKSGVTVSELARAGAVTYRAMKRRVDRELQRQAQPE